MSACTPTSPRTACSISPIRAKAQAATRRRWRAPNGATAACAASRRSSRPCRGPSGGLHFGSRIAFDRAGLMYVTTGERYNKPRAQDLGDLGGKVVRLRDDGTVPPDNPFVGRAGARPEIFTWGHRNPQGLAVHPETGRIWEVEHGPRGGDELNILKAGANYGWPKATGGIDYDGSIISPYKTLPGMEDPIRTWVPSISPSGLCFYTGTAFPGWKGSLFTGGAVGLCAVPDRAGRRALRRRGTVDRGPASLYPRCSPGTRRVSLSRHPQQRVAASSASSPRKRIHRKCHACSVSHPCLRQPLPPPASRQCRSRVHDRAFRNRRG